MTRLVLAVIAIIVLTLSAGFSHAPLQTPTRAQASSALQAFGSRQVMMAEIELMRPVHARELSTASSPSEEGPAPALLAYLALVLIGSAIAVGMVRYSQARETSS